MKKIWREDVSLEENIKSRNLMQKFIIIVYGLAMICLFVELYYYCRGYSSIFACTMFIAFLVMLVVFLIHRCNLQLFIYLKRQEKK